MTVKTYRQIIRAPRMLVATMITTKCLYLRKELLCNALCGLILPVFVLLVLIAQGF